MIAKIYLSLGILEVIQKYQKTTQNTKNQIGNRIAVCLLFMILLTFSYCRHHNLNRMEEEGESSFDERCRLWMEVRP